MKWRPWLCLWPEATEVRPDAVRRLAGGVARAAGGSVVPLWQQYSHLQFVTELVPILHNSAQFEPYTQMIFVKCIAVFALFALFS